LTVILGSAGLLQEFHRVLGPEDIALLAAGITEAALRLNQMADRLVDAEGKRPSPPARQRLECGSGSSNSGDVRSAAKEAAFRAGRLADLRLDLQDVPVRVPPILLRTLVSEIVKNAIDLSDHGATVRVLLRADGLGSRLEIASGGTKGTRDRGRRPLREARRIADVTGGALEVDRRVARGTVVRVRWREAGQRDPGNHPARVVRIRIPYDNRA
jgi:hypothetical protein